MTAPSAAYWNEAFQQAEGGKWRMLSDLIGVHGLPTQYNERMARVLVAPKRTQRGKELADAFEEFHRLTDQGLNDREASAVVCERFNIRRQSVLDNTLAKVRDDANVFLRERGLLESTKFSR